jgi:DNA polymerase III delta prime subunit
MAFNGKYDPKTLDDLVIDPTNKHVLELMIAGKLQDHLLLEGANGTAKSTIAELLPRLKHGSAYQIEHVLGHEDFEISQQTLDLWAAQQAWCRINHEACYIVIDEIDTIEHGLSLLWQWLDGRRDCVTVIGTTNKLMAIPKAMRSRMKCLTFRPVKAIDMLPRALQIIQAEGLEVNKAYLLSELQAVEGSGDIRKYMERLALVAIGLRTGAISPQGIQSSPAVRAIHRVK